MTDFFIHIAGTIVVAIFVLVLFRLITRRLAFKELLGKAPDFVSVLQDLKFLPFIYIFSVSFILIICWLISLYDMKFAITIFSSTNNEDIWGGLENYSQLDVPIFLVVLATIIGPFIEEVVFRGVLLLNLAKWNKILGLLLVSLFFALLHIAPVSIFSAFIGGLVLGVLFLKYQGILVPYIYHFLQNAFVIFIALFHISFIDAFNFEDQIFSNFEGSISYILLAFVFSLPFVYLFFRRNIYVLKKPVIIPAQDIVTT